ncbi:cytochrome b5 reductase 4 isoform X1 [Oryzias melastigma]|uniref:cytochrome b5 reductase 4 isoform X1 n=1 Tax=Oryzias melastigma TaxID=30732 RepID=UPI000CF82876|nr:cytochrome b5 reductase 4 isoform X1 [Oryzias melastigma]
MIKVYPDGVFTQHLNSLQTGDHISVSGPEGSFSLRLLRDVTHLFLLAAGTGFTPMARLIRFSLQEIDTVRLDYCISLYIGIDQSLLHCLRLVQNSAARLLMGTRRCEHIAPIYALFTGCLYLLGLFLRFHF